MSVPRFYVEGWTGRAIRLSGQEAVHAARARRLSVHEEVSLFDGTGREAAGRVMAVSRSVVEIEIGETVERPRPLPALTLAVALPKGPRQDTLIEKCTELGVATIVPLLTGRSVSSASEHKLERWRRTAIEAAKQSRQAWLPAFQGPERIDEALRRVAEHELAVVAAMENRGESFLELMLAYTVIRGKGFPLRGGARKDSRTSDGDFTSEGGREVHPPERVLALVGPEGGWTREELETIMAAGCRPVSLGPNILRIETAAIALAALVHLMQANRPSD